MAITYKLDKFEGPLDLLLHLIESNKVDIYDIPIAEITQQYLDYMSHMEREDLDLVSDFLVMAATLLDIKSRMLLPVTASEESEPEDPRAELVTRLLEYKKYREMGEKLAECEMAASGAACRKPSLPSEVKSYEQPVDLDSLLEGLTLAKLKKIYDGVMRRREDRLDPVRGRFREIRRESVTLRTRVADVLSFARRNRHFRFTDMLRGRGGREETVVTFLAVLELEHVGKIHLTQKALFDEIVIDTLEQEGEETDPELDPDELAMLEG